MKYLARFMVWSLRFELAISRQADPFYLRLLRQDLARWQGVADRL